jgi:hypothetical protein
MSGTIPTLHHTANGMFRDNFTFMISPPSPNNFFSALAGTNWVFTSESVKFFDSNNHCWYFVCFFLYLFIYLFISFLLLSFCPMDAGTADITLV